MTTPTQRTDRLIVPAVAAALIGEQKPCETCGGVGLVPPKRPPHPQVPGFCLDCGKRRPLVSWWPSRVKLTVGERIEVVAGRITRCDGDLVGQYLVRLASRGDIGYPHSEAYIRRVDQGLGNAIRLRPGEVVATVVVTDRVPVVRYHPFGTRITDYLYVGSGRHFAQLWINGVCTDLSDLLAYGLDFQPGQWAVALGEVEPA